ncbi:hypothetical protein [Ensifer sp. SL37]|nr:hypothetical protein [Ensifer sp. SL37]MCY1740587.1 hypothetical protein [Ensifer sp. SL37]
MQNPKQWYVGVDWASADRLLNVACAMLKSGTCFEASANVQIPA